MNRDSTSRTGEQNSAFRRGQDQSSGPAIPLAEFERICTYVERHEKVSRGDMINVGEAKKGLCLDFEKVEKVVKALGYAKYNFEYYYLNDSAPFGTRKQTAKTEFGLVQVAQPIPETRTWLASMPSTWIPDKIYAPGVEGVKEKIRDDLQRCLAIVNVDTYAERVGMTETDLVTLLRQMGLVPRITPFHKKHGVTADKIKDWEYPAE